MNEFDHIDVNNEKVKKIISCGIKEFALNDYDRASTNNIVKDAGISRGILYHYFKNKKELFDFLLFYAFKISTEILEREIDWAESDLLVRIRQGLIASIETYKCHPHLVGFYRRVGSREEMIIYKEEMEKYHPNIRNKFYTHNIDFANIKEGVDIDKMINVIKATFKVEGSEFWQEGSSEYSPEDLMKLYDGYIGFFRTTFYK